MYTKEYEIRFIEGSTFKYVYSSLWKYRSKGSEIKEGRKVVGSLGCMMKGKTKHVSKKSLCDEITVLIHMQVRLGYGMKDKGQESKQFKLFWEKCPGCAKNGWEKSWKLIVIDLVCQVKIEEWNAE